MKSLCAARSLRCWSRKLRIIVILCDSCMQFLRESTRGNNTLLYPLWFITSPSVTKKSVLKSPCRTKITEVCSWQIALQMCEWGFGIYVAANAVGTKRAGWILIHWHIDTYSAYSINSILEGLLIIYCGVRWRVTYMHEETWHAFVCVNHEAIIHDSSCSPNVNLHHIFTDTSKV